MKDTEYLNQKMVLIFCARKIMEMFSMQSSIQISWTCRTSWKTNKT